MSLVAIFLGYGLGLIISSSIEVFQMIWQASFLIGILSSLLMVSIHIFRVRSLPTHEPENISPTQTRSLTLTTNQSTAFEACLSSLMLISGKIIEQNEPFLLKARTPPVMSSLGQEIEFSIKSIDDSRTLITFTSHPMLKTALFDFGTSIETIEKIYWYLEEKFK